MAFENGPYVQAACFCENVIVEASGVLSLIRVIDTVTHSVQGPEPPPELPPFVYNIKFVLMLKPGNAEGRQDLNIRVESPRGESQTIAALTVHLNGEERGANAISDMNLTLNTEGLYWFHVILNDEKLTSLPLRVRYNRVIIRA